MTHLLIIPELLENIFSFLVKDKTLYPALFVNRLWYYCSAPILWRRIEFSIEDNQQRRWGKNTSGPLYWQFKKFKRVMCEKIKSHYCSKIIYLKLAGLKISDALLIAILRSCPDINFLILDRSDGFSNIPIMKIAKYCLKLLHLSLDACKAITDKCIFKIARSCPNLKYISLASLYRDSNIYSESVIEIARSCLNLVYLNLNGQPFINNESICIIARSCVNLQHLDLSFNDIITDEAICAIATGCPDMRSYFLEECKQITNKSIKKIAQLNQNLQKLILTSCYGITNDAVCNIVRSCPNIQNLSFQYIHITDKTIYEIAYHCSNLSVLNVKKCPFISDKSIYFLLSKKPTLDIDW
ncbi:22118_t:CDS:1 [Dentiscutata erythropus]|uniref:22118_t:CDS:1 n=1 Tax=Dentiscutata erythropus TaxID=1348616 RepID=A0A9N9NYJ2_9GLOM|nr:22118_t:CDS:1 [Dentiscutata erythropus]